MGRVIHHVLRLTWSPKWSPWTTWKWILRPPKPWSRYHRTMTEPWATSLKPWFVLGLNFYNFEIRWLILKTFVLVFPFTKARKLEVNWFLIRFSCFKFKKFGIFSTAFCNAKLARSTNSKILWWFLFCWHHSKLSFIIIL